MYLRAKKYLIQDQQFLSFYDARITYEFIETAINITAFKWNIISHKA